ncbi:MAG: ATP synthase F0 subunit B [Kofleriaceae bacterium]
MRKLLLAALLFSSTAHAQIDEPKTETKVENAEGKTKPEPEADPSRHFNYTNLHYSGKDEYGGAFGDGTETTSDGVVLHEEEPMSPPFIFMILNFAVLIWLLVKYLLPAGQKMSEQRHDLIQNALDEATKLRDQAKAKLAEYEARVKGLDDEISKLVAGIRADAEGDKARILEQAQAQAATMKREAEQRIQAEIELARAALTKEVTLASTAAAEKLLKEKVTADDQRGLVSTFIVNVDAAPRSAS